MMNPQNGRWAFLSTGNIENIAKFFRGVREQACETRGTIYAAPNFREAIATADLDWPKGWDVYQGGPLWNPTDDWFGILWDDQCPESPRWDIGLVTHAIPWRVVASQHAMSGDWRKAAICWGIKCLEAGGGIDLAGDVEAQLTRWSRASMKAQCWYIESGISLPRHTKVSEREFPVTDDTEMVASLVACMDAHGARVIRPNWDGVSLQISTPSMASRPEALYTISMFSTLTQLHSQGVKAEWTLERYNADIGLARSHIFSEFVRSNHTHLLMIDDDMSWQTTAISRLIFANKPLVAVAGPKKKYPLTFAASHISPDGKPQPLLMDPDTGAAEVSSVGAAFMMIRRDCAEAMVKAYPELEYVHADGKISWGMFVQLVENRNYLAEDFAFCQRWRRIGGQVYICPDVPLGHIGAHEFKGDLLSNALKQAVQ